MAALPSRSSKRDRYAWRCSNPIWVLRRIRWMHMDVHWQSTSPSAQKKKLEAARKEPIRNRMMSALSYDAALRRGELCRLLHRLNRCYLRGRCPLPTHASKSSRHSFIVKTSRNAWACHSDSCVADEVVALAATSWTSWHAWKARPSAMRPSGSRTGSAPPATHSDAMKAVLATGAHLLPFNQN